ncbi:LacI family DNA-binding transcriptional regulator [Bacillus massiliigorillae]|uniref:LacI family DNA-binding transcriptional regulator n=1 Tax=Bacillus massiliigorillae TaxID=1243664 RepID=UPI0003A3F6F9|nr:LacI family DNA-binding transcriptional regulator [Bacillus massiliigorillae]
MKKPTIKDVARVSKFSIATVSRVLNGKGNVSPEIATKVMDAAKQLNYVPNQLAKGLKEQKTNIIGVVVPDLRDPYFVEVIQLLQQKLQPENIHLLVTESKYSVKKELELLQQLEAKRVDGIVIAGVGKNEKFLTELVVKGIKVVSLHSKVKNLEIEIPQVIEDEEEIVCRLTSKLIAEGHRTIGVINGSKSYPNAIERYVGYVKGMYTGGEVLDSAYTYEGAYEIESGRKAVKRFLALPSRPTAILCLHPYFTIGVIAELRRKKIRIPRDIAIATLGNDPSFIMLEDKELITYSYDVNLAVEEILFYIL